MTSGLMVRIITAITTPFIEFVASNTDKRTHYIEGKVGKRLRKMGGLWDLHKIGRDDLWEMLKVIDLTNP